MGVKDIECLVRNNVLSMEPYSTARDEYQGEIGTLLDANENPFDRKGLNRYPSRHRRNALLEKVASIKGLRKESTFLGNGSDESIDLCYRVFCNPGEDNAVIMAPSYGMYSVCADMNGVERRLVMLPEDFSLPVEGLLGASDSSTKLMFICSPNNPTGNSFPEYEIRKLLESFKGMLVLDEAYVDFSERGSM
ncbi:MAG: aminotransferase class I/II-fold pyridoxal phosphate-dependent enzyme, partial [Bacteroidales bacterium]|nr:aminotransferase class I/II-fold pyridoxal phosphate-dependent enzyme [Bacteroidales bacterium]